ncbi:hypothetical protein ACFVU2_09860 [Leifsonia sp. NPDC058194]|uniref:hypothetical protein n=1 Tax=Leifsonia sp. NPDC058194 TaxID=3346374 RepID=UPI0036DC8245
MTSTSYGYDGVDRLASSTASSGEKNTYAYDPAGNRTGWTCSGAADGNFSQTAAFNDSNQLTRSNTSGAGRGVSGGVASYSYDRAGNRVSQSVAETTANVFDGTSMPQSTSSTQGTTTLVRDAAGALAEHVTASGEATWDLLDGLGSTIAGITGASITQLASCDDWGGQAFESNGWDAP